MEADAELHRTKKILADTKKELEFLKSQSSSRQKEVKKVKDELTFIQSELSTVGKNKMPKNVVDAASAVVASINTKYFAAQKEINALKQALDKERKGNQKSE